MKVINGQWKWCHNFSFISFCSHSESRQHPRLCQDRADWEDRSWEECNRKHHLGERCFYIYTFRYRSHSARFPYLCTLHIKLPFLEKTSAFSTTSCNNYLCVCILSRDYVYYKQLLFCRFYPSCH